MSKIVVDGKVFDLPGGNTGVDFTVDDTLNMSENNILSVSNPNKGIISQEDFDRLSSEEQKRGTYIIPTNDAGFSGGEVYSKDEIRIGTWIDGEPLYRKVYITKSPSTDTPNGFIASLPTNCVIQRLYGYLHQANGNSATVPMIYSRTPTVDFTHYIGLWAEKNGNINCNVYGEAYENGDLTVVVEYTKTID